MSTVLFHRMKLAPNDRTQIRVVASAVKSFCHGCSRVVCTDVVITKFLSLPLAKCSLCGSVIQHSNGKQPPADQQA